MKCSKLLKEAFEGINFTYKLDDTLNAIDINQKFNTKQMVGYLTKRGVSPKEIEAAGLETWFKSDYPLEASEWQNRLQSAQHKFKETDIGSSQYEGVTLGEKGRANPTYKETLMQGQRFEKSPTDIRHFGEFEAPNKSLLGWRRTHVDEINGKPSTVLNEFQSDWAQTERSGRGTFESNAKQGDIYYNITDIERNEAAKLLNKAREKFFYNKSDDYIDNHWEEFVSYRNSQPDLVEAEQILYARSTNPLVADFPMTEKKFHQFQIVGALDEAIKNGTKRVVIPIERENELAGSKGVTKFYDSLNIKILPEIRKKLEAQGMKLNVHKEGYDKSRGDNLLHVIEIEEIPEGKVKWDVYSTLGAIGLGGLAEKLKEQEKQ